jgi:hypothetical protein
LKLV